MKLPCLDMLNFESLLDWNDFGVVMGDRSPSLRSGFAGTDEGVCPYTSGD